MGNTTHNIVAPTSHIIFVIKSSLGVLIFLIKKYQPLVLMNAANIHKP